MYTQTHRVILFLCRIVYTFWLAPKTQHLKIESATLLLLSFTKEKLRKYNFFIKKVNILWIDFCCTWIVEFDLRVS